MIIDDQFVASLFSLSQRQQFSAWSEFFDEDLTSGWRSGQRLDPDDPNIRGKNWEAVEKAGKVANCEEVC